MVRFIHPKRGSAKHRQPPSPLLGKTITGFVTDLGAQGHGIVTLESGEKVFVSGAWEGEHIKAKITHQKQKLLFAKTLEVLTPHPDRHEPPCAHHTAKPNACGGCPWLFMSYSAQLAAKQKRVAAALAPLLTSSAILHPILGAPNPLGYRHRAQFKTDGQTLGFLSAHSHQLVSIDDCQALTEGANQQLHRLHQQLPNCEWQSRKRNRLTTLDINETKVSVNQRLPFAQANRDQNHMMRRWLRQTLSSLPRTQGVLELFAGSGNFTEVIAELGFNQITAVEGVMEATEALGAKQLPNVHAITQDLFHEQGILRLTQQLGQIDTLVLDPPREGFKIIGFLTQALKDLQQVMYISCDLATFKRDAQVLIEQGFQLLEVQPVDGFAQTPHVELLATFTRRRAS